MKRYRAWSALLALSPLLFSASPVASAEPPLVRDAGPGSDPAAGSRRFPAAASQGAPDARLGQEARASFRPRSDYYALPPDLQDLGSASSSVQSRSLRS